MIQHSLDCVNKLSLEQVTKIEKVREAAKAFYETVSEHCPGSREKSIAFTKIEEAVMWANKSVSHN